MPSTTSRRSPDCTFTLDAELVEGVAGEPIAVALFASGTQVLSRSIKYHRPRGFFCLAGHCGACLMRIDGQPNVKACMTPVTTGVVVERQTAFPSGAFDVLEGADFFFPKGMDHHTMFTSPRALNRLMQKVVRELGGLGTLPDKAPEQPAAESERVHVDVAVVGGGPAGLSAALAIKRAVSDARVVVFDEGGRAGGSLRCQPGRPGPAEADQMVSDARSIGIDVRERTTAVAWYPEDDGGLLAVVGPGLVRDPRRSDSTPPLWRVTARCYVYATGGYDLNVLFANNDRPGILPARAVGRLLVDHGVVAGRRPLVMGTGGYAEALTRALVDAGADAISVDTTGERPIVARGHTWVRGLDVASKGQTRRLRCDLIAVATTPAPASDVPRQHGVAVQLDEHAGGFACIADDTGRTNVPGVFVAGDVRGFEGVESAIADGTRVGRAVAASLRGAM